MINVLLKLREIHSSLSPTEKSVSQYIQDNAQESTNLTIRELAERTYSSPSSVVRLCRSIGFQGYKEFKQALTFELATLNHQAPSKNWKIAKDDSVSTIIDKVTYQNMKSFEETLHLIDHVTLEKCVDLLLKSKRILLFGIGSSQLIAKDFYLKLLRLNKNALVNEDVHSQILQAINATPQDIALVYSYSGETKEVLECVDLCIKNLTTVIAITRYSQSKLLKKATYCLYTSASEPLFRNGAMSSQLSQLNINDILYSCMINKDYDKSLKRLTVTYINKS